MLKKAASLDVCLCSKEAAERLLHPPAQPSQTPHPPPGPPFSHLGWGGGERPERILDKLSLFFFFLVLPTKRCPAWPFGYCKISTSVFYLAHHFSQDSLRARIGVRARLSDSLARVFSNFVCCRPRRCLTKARRRKVSSEAFIPASVTLNSRF